MSETQTNATVSIEEHNKIVSLANQRAAELEQMKQKQVEMEAIQRLKEEWKQEQEQVKREIEEIKRNVDNTKVAKGVVKADSQSVTNDPIAKLDKVLPPREKNPEKYASALRRLTHYKNPTTEAYTREQVGMALSLHGGAQRTTRGLVSSSARADRGDLVLRRVESQ